MTELFDKILSDNNLDESLSESESNKRARESLDNSLNTPKKQKSLKSEMEEANNALLKKLCDQMQISNTNIAALTSEMQQMKVNFGLQLSSLESKMEKYELQQNTTTSELATLKSDLNNIKIDSMVALNKINQKSLELNVIGFGIPAQYIEKKQELIDKLNEKTQLSLSLRSFESISAQNRKKEEFCTFFFKFNETSIKKKFMLAIDKLRTHNNKKDILTLEDLFDEYRPTNKAGHTIAFRNQITTDNQKILKAAKGNKSIAHAWEKDGKIWIRRAIGERPVEALSLEQVYHHV